MSDENQKAELDKAISVFTLNLRFGLADDGPNSWKFRKKGFPDLLNEFLSDFMAFQEVNDFQGNFLERLLDGYYYIGKRKPAPRFWQNSLIFYESSWQCIGWEHFFFECNTGYSKPIARKQMATPMHHRSFQSRK